MDIVLGREKLLHDYGSKSPHLNKPLTQPLAFEIFQHTFVDDKEKAEYVDVESPASGLLYMFKRAPPITDANISMSFPKHGAPNVVYTYLFYYDTKEEVVGFVCAPVKNNLEFGSKHTALVSKLNDVFKSRILDMVFVQAGEMMMVSDDVWSFNHFSGTYTKTRIDEVASWAETPEDFGLDDMKPFIDSLNDWNLTKSLFVIKSPMLKFEFASGEFKKEYLPLSATLSSLPSEVYYPYVIPNSSRNATMFEKAVQIISTFANLKDMKPMSVNVTTQARELVGSKTSISVKHVDENNGPTVPNNRFSNRVTVLPYKVDLKLALGVMRAVGARKLNYEKKTKTPADAGVGFDLFQLEGKTFQVDKLGKLLVKKFLASSNDIVYLCDVKGGVQVVLKVISLYPFSKSNGMKYFYRNNAREESFYGTTIHTFAIPGHAGLGIVFPYLGKTITSLTERERRELYPKFKEQYVNLWITKTMKPNVVKGTPLASFYNDMKPANTTYDKSGNFHLIDVDETAHTPQYYGPSDERVFYNQMFGVLMVLYWFKTGRTPFGANWTGKQKLKWVEEELEKGSDIKEMFTILMDPDLSDNQKLIMFY